RSASLYLVCRELPHVASPGEEPTRGVFVFLPAKPVNDRDETAVWRSHYRDASPIHAQQRLCAPTLLVPVHDRVAQVPGRRQQSRKAPSAERPGGRITGAKSRRGLDREE